MFSVGLGRNTSDQAGVTLDMDLDGLVIMRTGAADMGQGIHTVLAQMAAEALGVESASIRVLQPVERIVVRNGRLVCRRWEEQHSVTGLSDPAYSDRS